MQNVAGPSLVAMATKFGLGAETQSPTGLYEYTCSPFTKTATNWPGIRGPSAGVGKLSRKAEETDR